MRKTDFFAVWIAVENATGASRRLFLVSSLRSKPLNTGSGRKEEEKKYKTQEDIRCNCHLRAKDFQILQNNLLPRRNIPIMMSKSHNSSLSTTPTSFCLISSFIAFNDVRDYTFGGRYRDRDRDICFLSRRKLMQRTHSGSCRYSHILPISRASDGFHIRIATSFTNTFIAYL